MLIWNRSGFIDRIAGQENHRRESTGSVNLFVRRPFTDSAAGQDNKISTANQVLKISEKYFPFPL